MDVQCLNAAKNLLDRIIWLETRTKLGHNDTDAPRTPEMMQRLTQVLKRADTPASDESDTPK